MSMYHPITGMKMNSYEEQKYVRALRRKEDYEKFMRNYRYDTIYPINPQPILQALQKELSESNNNKENKLLLLL